MYDVTLVRVFQRGANRQSRFQDAAGNAPPNSFTHATLTQPGEDVVRYGVAILGPLNLPSTLAYHASQMYSKNVTNFLAHLLKDGKIQLDLSDELTRGPLVTHQGEIVHEVVKQALLQRAGS